MTRPRSLGSRRLSAITVTGPQMVELIQQEVNRPPLGPQEVEGATLFSLVSPGTELNSLFSPRPEAPPTYPAVPGYAAVFSVDAVGADVRGLSPGDIALAFFGGHASHQRQLASHVVRVPPELSPSVAPFARLAAITTATIATTTARPPGPVGVSGLGIVGHLAALQFAACGYEVTAWDPNPARRALMRRPDVRVLGEAPIDPQVARDDSRGFGPFQLVVESSGIEQAVLDACAVVRKRGEVVMVGLAWRPRSDTSAFELLRTIFNRYAVLRSGWEWEVPLHETDFRTGDTVSHLAGTMRWLAQGRIDVTGLATKAHPGDCQAVYEGLLDGTWPTPTALFDWQT